MERAVQKLANFFAHIARVLLHVFALFVMCRKMWPHHLMSTPLGKLTFFELVSGLAGLVGMVVLVGAVVYNLFHPERPDEREPAWAGHWIVAFGFVVALVAFAVLYRPPTDQQWVDAVHAVALAIVVWLLS